MTLQEAVEAPRLWTQGQALELEDGYANHDALKARGWSLLSLPHIGGGMAAIEFGPDTMTGAACWRADGLAMGLGGGQARAGTRFWPGTPAPNTDET